MALADRDVDRAYRATQTERATADRNAPAPDASLTHARAQSDAAYWGDRLDRGGPGSAALFDRVASLDRSIAGATDRNARTELERQRTAALGAIDDHHRLDREQLHYPTTAPTAPHENPTTAQQIADNYAYYRGREQTAEAQNFDAMAARQTNPRDPRLALERDFTAVQGGIRDEARADLAAAPAQVKREAESARAEYAERAEGLRQIDGSNIPREVRELGAGARFFEGQSFFETKGRINDDGGFSFESGDRTLNASPTFGDGGKLSGFEVTGSDRARNLDTSSDFAFKNGGRSLALDRDAWTQYRTPEDQAAGRDPARQYLREGGREYLESVDRSRTQDGWDVTTRDLRMSTGGREAFREIDRVSTRGGAIDRDLYRFARQENGGGFEGRTRFQRGAEGGEPAWAFEGRRLDARGATVEQKEAHFPPNAADRQAAAAEQTRIAGEQQKLEAEAAKARADAAWLATKTAADVGGLVDPTPISDGVGGIMSLAERDWVGAGLSLASMVPYLGDAFAKPAKGARAARHAAEIAQRLERTEDALSALRGQRRALDGADAAGDAARQLDAVPAPRASRAPDAPRADAPRTGAPRGPDDAGDIPRLPGGPFDVRDVLRMSPDEFATNPEAQRRLYEAATQVRDTQNATAANVLAELGVTGGEAKSILKRDNFDDFVHGVREKLTRKDYDDVGTMSDMARGRFNLDTPDDVRRVSEELSRRYPGAEVVEPRTGYPRFHVVITDPATGIKHEWQVGTKATTNFLETNSVRIPEGLHLTGAPNFHDVHYDYIARIEDPGLRAKYGLDVFKQKYDELLVETGNGTPQNFAARYDQISDQLSQILARIHRDRPGFLEGLSHK